MGTIRWSYTDSFGTWRTATLPDAPGGLNVSVTHKAGDAVASEQRYTGSCERPCVYRSVPLATFEAAWEAADDAPGFDIGLGAKSCPVCEKRTCVHGVRGELLVSFCDHAFTRAQWEGAVKLWP